VIQPVLLVEDSDVVVPEGVPGDGDVDVATGDVEELVTARNGIPVPN